MSCRRDLYRRNIVYFKRYYRLLLWSAVHNLFQAVDKVPSASSLHTMTGTKPSHSVGS